MPAVAQHGMLLGDPDHPADRGPEQDADPRRLVGTVEGGVREGLRRRGEAEKDVPVEPPRLLRPDDRRRIETLHLGSDAHRKAARVERADEVDPAAAGDGGVPGRAQVVPERRYRAQPGDHHLPHQPGA